MRIKQLTDEQYRILGVKEWEHRERDRLGAVQRLLSKKPDARVRSLALRPYPTQKELVKLGKYRQFRAIKDRMYSKKRYSKLKNMIT